MENLEFGLTATVVGMGTTFVTLIFLGFVMDALKRVFPLEERKPEAKPAPAGQGGEKP